MICEVRENGNEVVLRHPKIGDIIALIVCFVHKDKEIVFSRPEEAEDV